MSAVSNGVDRPLEPMVTGRVSASYRNGDALGREISLARVAKSYRGISAVHSLDLDIRAGELVTLLGSSGSGKTTTLMMIAGFTEPSAGNILIGGRDVTHVPPHRRGIGVVFQHYALFPHMTVAENVAFPLRMRHLPRAEVEDRVKAALDLVELGALLHRFPLELSGGQQQRVAFARAIIFNPPVLLLDEPLGALDKKLREAIQLEIKALHRRLGLTMLYVTHDQSEALAISDRVAVLEAGRLEQIGTPAELYEMPATRFVADFIGEANFLRAHIVSWSEGFCVAQGSGGERFLTATKVEAPPGSAIEIMIRPERIYVGPDAQVADNKLLGHVEDIAYLGESTKYRVKLANYGRMTVRLQNRRKTRADIGPGEPIALGWHPEDALLFSTATSSSGKRSDQ
jgi:putative spermidine/putrescine transport system ATP-binding protein